MKFIEHPDEDYKFAYYFRKEESLFW